MYLLWGEFLQGRKGFRRPRVQNIIIVFLEVGGMHEHHAARSSMCWKQQTSQRLQQPTPSAPSPFSFLILPGLEVRADIPEAERTFACGSQSVVVFSPPNSMCFAFIFPQPLFSASTHTPKTNNRQNGNRIHIIALFL